MQVIRLNKRVRCLLWWCVWCAAFTVYGQNGSVYIQMSEYIRQLYLPIVAAKLDT